MFLTICLLVSTLYLLYYWLPDRDAVQSSSTPHLNTHEEIDPNRATIQYDISNLPPDAHDQIFRGLSYLDLRNYSRINRAAYQAVESFYRRAFQPEKALLPFFSKEEIYRLRILQYTIGFLISGSTALSFFERIRYPDADLDLYVDIRHCIFLTEFLVRSGYNYEPYRTDRLHQPSRLEDALEETIQRFSEGNWNGFESLYPAGTDIVAVLSFVRGSKKVQVIACQASPLSAILAFHSTVVMNFIGYSHAVSLYPRSTFIDRLSLEVRPEAVTPTRMELVREKYRRRGWKMIRAVSAAQSLRSDINAFDRHVGDRWCWTIPLLPIPPEQFIQGDMRLGRPEMNFMHSWKLNYDWKWREVIMTRSGFWIPGQLEQKYCFSEETLAEVREFVGHEEIGDATFERGLQRIVTKLYAARARKDHPDNTLRLMLLDIFQAADAKYPELSFIRRHRAYAAQLLADVFRPLLLILGDKFEYRCTFLQTEADNVWMRITIRVPLALERNQHMSLINIDPKADVLQQLGYQRVEIKFLWVAQAGNVLDIP